MPLQQCIFIFASFQPAALAFLVAPLSHGAFLHILLFFRCMSRLAALGPS
jgi:hypothetical protein